jgi:hypothetical protein
VADVVRWKAGKEALERRISEEKNWQETLKWNAGLQKKKADEEAAAAVKKAASDKSAEERAEKLKKDTEEYTKVLDKAKLSMQALSDTATQGWDRIDDAVVAVNNDSDEYNESLAKARESIQSMSDKVTDGWDRIDGAVASVGDSLYDLSSGKKSPWVGMTEEMRMAYEESERLNESMKLSAVTIQALSMAAMSGYQSMTEALGAALVSGEDGWKAFGRAGLNAVAAVVEAMAIESDILISKAMAQILMGDVTKIPGLGQAIATSVLAHGSAGAIRAIPMAEGGSGMVTKPTLFLAGEAGPESFAFGGANNKAMGGGSTRVYNTVNQYIGGSVIAERQVKSLAMSGMAQAARGY